MKCFICCIRKRINWLLCWNLDICSGYTYLTADTSTLWFKDRGSEVVAQRLLKALVLSCLAKMIFKKRTKVSGTTAYRVIVFNTTTKFF